jgi:hypothetical protein
MGVNTKRKEIPGNLIKSILQRMNIPGKWSAHFDTIIENNLRKESLPGQVSDNHRTGETRKEKYIYKKENLLRLWKNKKLKNITGEKINVLKNIFSIIKEHTILTGIIITGTCFFFLPALLFGSFYRAFVAGHSLSVFPTHTLPVKCAHILGRMGSILLFFTSLTILLQYTIMKESRDREIRKTANNYLSESKNSQAETDRG